MKTPHERDDLAFVSEWLSGYGLRAQRFSKSEMLQGKTPDFQLYRADQLVAYCEVKSPRDVWLDTKLEGTEPFEIAGGLRPDPSFNRIAGHVEKATKQFDAVNADRIIPNVLILINWAGGNCFQDLEEVLTGYLPLQGGLRAPTMLNIAEGRSIGERKHRIDLFVWIDGPSRRPMGMFFGSSREFENDICSWFDLDPSRIERR